MARVRIEPGGKVLIAAVVFCLFLFLFFKVKGSISTKAPPLSKPSTIVVDSEQLKTQPPRSEPAPQTVSEEVQQPATTDMEGRPIRIFFDFNRAVINRNVYCIFDRIERLARQIGRQKLDIVVEGNADSTGPKLYNLYLSRKRATRVADSLSKRLGIPLKSIRIVANGFSKPAASNRTRDGRAENRRTEVIIYH